MRLFRVVKLIKLLNDLAIMYYLCGHLQQCAGCHKMASENIYTDKISEGGRITAGEALDLWEEAPLALLMYCRHRTAETASRQPWWDG